MNKTKIEWVQNPDGTLGYTWNPITGCLNHDNGLCKGGGFPCYAYRLAHGRLKERYLANKNWDTRTPKGYEGYPNLDPFYPRFWLERLEAPVKGYTRTDWSGGNAAASNKGIFVCDMSDLFGIGVPEEWTKRILAVIKRCHYHRFYLLTKQPQNLIKFSPFPDNCWVGVTATHNCYFAGACVHLRDVKAKVKFLSIEPYLEGISGDEMDRKMLEVAGINWLIIGAQTKPYKPPKVEWVKEIVEAADKAGVKVFLKDNLKPLILQAIYKGELENTDYKWAFEGKLRQEMPK